MGLKDIIQIILVVFLIVAALALSFYKSLLQAILIFMGYSTVMSIIWLFLESPDLAITEAAVGAGITTVLFLITLRNVNLVKEEKENT